MPNDEIRSEILTQNQSEEILDEFVRCHERSMNVGECVAVEDFTLLSRIP